MGGGWRAPRKAAQGRAGIGPRVKLGGAGEVFTRACCQPALTKSCRSGALRVWGVPPRSARVLLQPPDLGHRLPQRRALPREARPPAPPLLPLGRPSPTGRPAVGTRGVRGHKPIGGGQGGSRPSPILAKPSGSGNAWAAAAGGGGGGGGPLCYSSFPLVQLCGRLAATRFVSIWGSMVQAWKLKLRPSLCEIERGHLPKPSMPLLNQQLWAFGGRIPDP